MELGSLQSLIAVDLSRKGVTNGLAWSSAAIVARFAIHERKSRSPNANLHIPLVLLKQTALSGFGVRMASVEYRVSPL